MRVLIFFDLPVVSNVHKKEYREFRKFLLRNGFIKLQNSVYCKLSFNRTATNIIINNIKKNKPQEGIIQLLVITDKQYAKMDIITKSLKKEVLDSDERLVIL